MRNPKLFTTISTKAERRFAERLKRARIPFKAKVKIGGREVDFVIGTYAIEINGHQQDPRKNEMLVREGYIPVHISNDSVSTTSLIPYVTRKLHQLPERRLQLRSPRDG